MANNITQCNFKITWRGEVWDITSCWKQANGEVAFWDGEIFRNGVRFSRIFLPKDVDEHIIKEDDDVRGR